MSETTLSLIPLEDQSLLDTTRETFNQIIERTKNFVISSDEGLGQATDMVKSLKLGVKQLEKRRKDLVDPYNEQVKQINNSFKGIQKIAEDGIKVLGGQMTQYHLQVEARLRAEEEEHRKLEAERLKAQEIELAEKAELEGKDVDAEMEKVKEREAELAGPMIKVPKSISHGTFGRSSIRKEWKHELLDITKVPARYLLLNEPAIRNAIAMGVRNIAGIRIYEKPTLITR